ncbi:MAG: hypothetical protein EXS32_07270 [Opitutus sp.]|nr:hypothetical protein [Opitutus sp.]
MPRLPGIGQRNAVRVPEKRGFRALRQGKHLIMGHGLVRIAGRRPTTINAYPMGPIAKVAGLTPGQFRELL